MFFHNLYWKTLFCENKYSHKVVKHISPLWRHWKEDFTLLNDTSSPFEQTPVQGANKVGIC